MNQSRFQLSDTYNGAHDNCIKQWASAAKAWGKPFFLRFDWEMNGWWFPWAERTTSSGSLSKGNQPDDYVKAWRHVHDLFAQVGANKATWVWCPNKEGWPHAPLTQLYPGDGYVDWTCVDGFNSGTARTSGWQSSAQVFQQSYNDLLVLAPSKPILIGEFASGEDGVRKRIGSRTPSARNYPNVSLR